MTVTTGLTMMPVTTDHPYNNDHDTVDDGTTSDPKSCEISVGGYARQALAIDSSFEHDSNDFAGLDHANVTSSSLAAGETIGGAVVYRYTRAAGTTSDIRQSLVSHYSVTATPTNGGDIVIAVAATSDGALIKFGSTSQGRL